MDIHNGRPGDTRNFVHKRLIGAVKGFISGGPIGAAGGFLGGGGGGAAVPRTTLVPGVQLGGRCASGFFLNMQGECVPLLGRQTEGLIAGLQRRLPGGASGLQEFGEAVLGQYGAALEPGFKDTQTAVCPRGTVLGTDGLCYNRRDLKNSERKWPRGRRPLLTGGEMRCISIASAAAKKLQRKEKQLQDMGMLKKHTAPRRRALPSAHHHHSEHSSHG